MMGKKSVSYVLAFLFLLNIFAWLTVFDLREARFLGVTFFDIGQGDAIFIETPGRNQILIDGGPDSAILEKLNESLPFWDRTIDLLVLTHPDSDHVTGLIHVLNNYKVENILWTGVVKEDAVFEKWQELIEKENARIFIAEAGQKIIAPGTDAEILFPFESLEGKPVKDANNLSAILKLDFGEISFLFTGDVYESTERKLVEKGIDIGSDILKVGHHGSKTSTCEEFVREVLPEVAVISAGKDNNYGHPHKETLDTLAKYDITIFRTDLQGDIKIISDGKNYGISTF
jgi:competence protein ComEC